MNRRLQNIFFGLLLAALIPSFATAQQSPCATTEQQQKLESAFPEITRLRKQAQQEASLNGARLRSTVVTIPVVVHVIYNTPQQNISNQQIQSQIDVLNEDFRKLNSDTAMTRSVFKNVSADCEIQFCLAQRDPQGNPTIGITRTQSATISWGCSDSMKFDNYGGKSGWPGSQYLNIWVCNLNCANGYAYYPGTPDPYDGVVVHYYVFGRTGNVAPGYMGRTGSHEVGHYLGLYHPFDYNQCLGTSPATCTSQGDEICDIPGSNFPSYGCDTTKNTCTDVPVDLPDQIENFMDYSDDVCQNMFSADQKSRIWSFLGTSRASLLTSVGCVPAGTSYYDVALTDISKPKKETCSGTINPVVRIANASTQPLINCELHYQLDAGPWQIFSWSGNLPAGMASTLNLPPLTIPQAGPHNFSCYVSNPNGFPDQNASNNAANRLFIALNPGTGQAFSLSEDFEGIAFPPQGWQSDNPGYNKAWEKSTAAGAYGLSSACAYYNSFYNGSTGTKDALLSPVFTLNGSDIPSVTFDVAYAEPLSSFYSDTLLLYASIDCGETWQAVWQKGGMQLATAPAPVPFGEFVPDSVQWRSESVQLPAYAGSPMLQLKFEIHCNWSNNLYLDNINFSITAGTTMAHPHPALNLFPNPASDRVGVSGHSATSELAWHICDLQGRVVLEGMTSKNDSAEITVAPLAKGVYIFILTDTEGQRFCSRLVKE